MPTIIELGQKVKQKYPGVYDDMPDIDVGQKVKQKYPGAYDDFDDVQQGSFKYELPVAPKTPEQRSVIKDKIVKENTAFQNQANKDSSPFGIIKNTIRGLPKAVFNTVASSEIGLGKTLAKLDNKPRQIYLDNLTKLQDEQTKLRRQISLKEKLGGDTSKLKQFYNENISQINNMQSGLDEANNIPTNNQAIGQIGGTALDLLTAGSYGGATSGARSSIPFTKKAVTAISPELGKISEQTASGLFTKKGLGNVAKGAGIGYGYDVSQGLQGARGEDRTNSKAFIPGLGTALGVGIPALSEGTQSFKNKYRPTKEQVGNAIDKLEGKLTEWSTGTNPGKKLVNKINQRTEAMNKTGTIGKTDMRTLAESGTIPEIKGLRFNTIDQSVEYRKQIKPLQEANRTALQEAGLSTVPTKIDVLEARAIKEARTPQNINSGRAVKMENEIRNEFNILRKEYPEGSINLSLQDDIKSARWDNVFGNKGLIDADVLKKDSEYAIAKALQKNIEEVASQAGHTEVAQLNREIGDRISASKFLESLDNKVLKGGRVGKYLGTLIGSSLGQSIPGKIVGAIGGNVIADLLIKSSVSSPVRRAILSKLSKEDPEAYTMTLKWLEEQAKLRSVRLALPAGGTQPIINQGRPIKVFPKSVEGKYIGKDIVGQSKSPTAQQTNPAITNVSKNPISTTISQKINKVKNILKKQDGFIESGFKNKGNLTTKILKDLEGKTTVSKQYILDSTNRGELKQVERDITRQVLDTMPDGQINVKEFADKVKSELLPLKLKKNYNANYPKSVSESGVPIMSRTKFESISLPSEIRGNVKNYDEHLWESPIKTSAGNTHFPNEGIDNYFGHTRIEDMADNKTRRVIEVQSDLYQKGNLERELSTRDIIDRRKYAEQYPDSPATPGHLKLAASDEKNILKEKGKLQQYNDPTAHFRMVREEIKKASQDGKTKLQFPTGETAMKIEGLGQTDSWLTQVKNSNGIMQGKKITPDDLKVGMEVAQQGHSTDWIITDVIGDGKFKAVPKQKWDDMDAGVFLYSGEEKRLNELWGKNQSTLTEAEKIERDALFAKADQLKESFQFNREIPDTEEFDISGKVDTNNPIYKFYEKDVQKYLNKFGGKRVVDDKGVSWIEIPITKEQGEAPVEAFGKIKINPLFAVAGASAVGVAGANIFNAIKNKNKKIEDKKSEKSRNLPPRLIKFK